MTIELNEIILTQCETSLALNETFCGLLTSVSAILQCEVDTRI